MKKRLMIMMLAACALVFPAGGVYAENTTAYEMGSVYAENTALLSDYGYEEGVLAKTGWVSPHLHMAYIPGDDISLGIKENEELNHYYERFGKENMIARNELVAKAGNGSTLQMMVEVNPNHESDTDILSRFMDLEGLMLPGDIKETKFAGGKLLTCAGMIGKEKYLLGVSTDTEDLVIAVKVRYESLKERDALLSRFMATDEEQEEALLKELNKGTTDTEEGIPEDTILM